MFEPGMKSVFRSAALALVVVGLATADAQAAQQLLVGDNLNSRVLRFDLDGNYLGVFASGFGPTGIQYGPDGKVYIGAGSAGEIRRYDLDGSFLGNAFNGQVDVAIDDIAFDASGTLYFNDSFGNNPGDQQIYRVDDVNTASVFVAKNLSDPNNLTTDDSLDTPRGLTFGANGNLYVADRNNSRLLEFSSVDGTLVNVVATGQSWIQTPIFYNGDIYFSMQVSSNSMLRVMNTSGNVLGTYSPGADSLCVDVVVAEDGDPFMAGYNLDRVYRFDASNSYAASIFATGVYDGVALNGPMYLALIPTAIPTPAALPAGAILLGVIVLKQRRGGASTR